jgi:hypothetical protein
MIEKDPDPDFPADALKAFGYTVRGLSPKDATRCRVFPDRIRYKLQKIIDHIANGLKNPNSEDGQALTDSGISPGAARQALDSLQSSFGIIVKQVITVCAIHEMGHACSLKGHVELKNGELKETTHGDPKCPMRDMGDTTDNRRLMILQVLFGLDHVLPLSYDRFCSSDEYHCFQSLNVNDR